jgi:hypothetical protein
MESGTIQLVHKLKLSKLFCHSSLLSRACSARLSIHEKTAENFSIFLCSVLR